MSDNKNNLRFFPRQVEYLYDNTKVALISNTLVSVITVWFIFELDGVAHDQLLIWLAAIFLIVLVRTLTTYFYKHRTSKSNVLFFYYVVFTINVVITGLLWGITPWLFASADQPEIAIILVFVVGGLASGATATMSVLPKVYFLYLLSTLVPIIIWFFVQGGNLYFVIALVLSFSIIGFITASLTYNKILIHSFELTEKVLKQKLQVIEASNAKSTFLSSMSHELRTPLNAIIGFSQLIIMNADKLNEEMVRNANEITNAGEYLLSLINDLLEISTIEANKVDLNLIDVDIKKIIDECLLLINATLVGKLNITIEYDNNNCVDMNVKADPLRVKQILLNILSNACKYNKQDGAVTINCEIIDGSYGRVSITDTGLGIPREKQANMFIAYDRLGQAQTGIQGTGLGLIISRQLLHAMGGKIGFKSKPGQGSCFWVDLPLVKTK